jgi:hypothetical protein
MACPCAQAARQGVCGRVAVASLVLVTTVTSTESLRLSRRAALFEGRDEIPVSMFITQYVRGEGPDHHLHPYPEVFVVQTAMRCCVS